MKKNTIILLFCIFLFNIVDSQIVKYSFNNVPFLDFTEKNSNITTSKLLLSAGSISDNVQTGSYFTDEPYVEESGGWNSQSISESKYFYVDMISENGYSFLISNIKFQIYSTSAGPSAVSVMLNDSVLLTENMSSGVLTNINCNVTNINNLTKVRLKIVGWLNGSRETSGNGILKLDNLKIYGDIYKTEESNITATKLNVKMNDNIWKDSLFNIFIEAVDIYGNIDKKQNGIVKLKFLNSCGNSYIDSMQCYFNQGICAFNNILLTDNDTVFLNISYFNNRDTIIKIPVIKSLFFDSFNNNLSKWVNTNDWKIDKQDTLSENGILIHKQLDYSGLSYISSKYDSVNVNANKIIWNINLANGNFDPTSTNKFWYYIMSNSSNLVSNTNKGYAIGVNLTGNTDTLALWRIDDDGTKHSILTTDFDWNKNNNLDIKIVREADGYWQIIYVNNKTIFYSIKVKDNIYNNLFYQGLVFEYTTTRSGLLWSDYISVSANKELLKPISIDVTTDTTINILFSKILDNTMVNIKYFKLYSKTHNKIIPINNIFINKNRPKEVILNVNKLSTSNYILYIENINNCTLNKDSIIFNYILPVNIHDIVFNEIMFDYYPPVDLPEADYIEIFNRSKNDINLNGWQIDIGGVKKKFPDKVIKSKEYIIITSSSQINNFKDFGGTLGIISTSSLTNTGKVIKLYSNSNKLIDSIYYNKYWIKNKDKRNGGWSLERIDPNNFCQTIGNWRVSESKIGGTPGYENSVKSVNVDLNPPYILNTNIFNKNTINIYFSELISNIDRCNFILNTNYPERIDVIDSVDITIVKLSFKDKINQKELYKLSVSHILDYCGNIIEDTIINIQYYNAEFYDIVINEIMVTPVNSLELQSSEYIELYNKTQFNIDITDWSIKIGSHLKNISNSLIPPNSYIILCNTEDYMNFNNINICLIDNLPNLPKKATIILKDKANNIICKTDYNSLWITDGFKAEGGYSIERIDYNNSDESKNNWIVSEDEKGGTPGFINSVYCISLDNIPPELLYAFPVNDTIVGLQFSEPIDYKHITKTMFYIEDINIKQIFNIDDNLDVLYLKLNNKLQKKVEYTIEVNDSITDIAGNNITNNIARIKLPIKVSSGDVVINEILFNPPYNGVDYVELYNKSAFVINLKQLLITSYDKNNNIKTPKQITDKGYLLFPSEYVVLSENEEDVKSKYWIKNERNFINMDMPTLPNDKGSVVLLDTNGIIIDYINYSDDMHFKLLNNTKGVSLERVDYNISAQEKTNWHSASELSGWGTPGYKNSMFNNLSYKKDNLISIEPKVFTPNNDGINDVLYINYNFKESGIVASIIIFNIKGKKVKTLINNELMSKNGILYWDGLDENSRKLSAGIYIIYFTFFNLDGNITDYRKACVIND